MRKRDTAVAALAATVLGAVMLTGCGTDDADTCRDETVVYVVTDGSYRYGDRSGDNVPDECLAEEDDGHGHKVKKSKGSKVKVKKNKTDRGKSSRGNTGKAGGKK